jgi:hypothetical protein
LRIAFDRIGVWTIDIVKRSDANGGFSFCSSAGWSNEPLHDWADVADWPRIGRNPSSHPKRGSTSPTSASQPSASQGILAY